MGTVKLSYEQREFVIILAAVKLANKEGLHKCNPASIAKACEIKTSEATVRFYFRRNADLWRAIAKHEMASNDVRSQAVAFGIL